MARRKIPGRSSASHGQDFFRDPRSRALLMAIPFFIRATCARAFIAMRLDRASVCRDARNSSARVRGRVSGPRISWNPHAALSHSHAAVGWPSRR